MPATRYQVILHALSPDATDAGGQFADTTQDAVPEEQLRKLLVALAGLTSRLSPEDTFRPYIRIKSPAGMAMITPIEGKLYYASWDTKGRGIEVTVDDIMAKVAVAAEAPKAARVESRAPIPVASVKSPKRKAVTVALLGIAIVVMNAVTIWMLVKPARSLLPPHVFLPDTESDALIKKMAGAYQTGILEGDRHLQIEQLGLLRFTVYGQNRSLRREHLQSGRGAKTVDGEVIITNESGVIKLIDPNTIAVYGDTYRRVLN